MNENLTRIQKFRGKFSELEHLTDSLNKSLPELLTKLYADCQVFAEREIKVLLARFNQIENELSLHNNAAQG